MRNNELLDDETAKLQAVDLAIKTWCWFAAEPARRFDLLLSAAPSSDTPTDVLEKFSSLTQEAKTQLEFMTKCLLNVVMSFLAYESLGTEKLYVILKRSYDEVPQQMNLKRLVALLVLLQVGFSMKNIPADVVGRAMEFIKQSSNSSILLLLSLGLYLIYMNPFLGETNRRTVEDLMVEIKLKSVAPPGKANSARGMAKGSLQAQLRKLRKIQDDEDDPEIDA